MKLHELTQIAKRGKKRLGQGHGSGRVKTSGRGTKGQKARRTIGLGFEGGALPLKKRMPFLRGKMRNKSLYAKPVVLSVKALNTLPKNTVVDVDALVKYNLVSATEVFSNGIKILGKDDVTVSLTVKVPTSASARKSIEKAQGTVEA